MALLEEQGTSWPTGKNGYAIKQWVFIVTVLGFFGFFFCISGSLEDSLC